MSIRKRKAKNKLGYTWQIDCPNPFGERIRKSGFQTKAEAEKYLAKIRLELESGNNANKSQKLVFVDVCEKFIINHCENRLKPSTVINYKMYLRKHIEPFFRKMKMLDVTSSVISKFIKQKKDIDGLSNKTINNILTMIKTVFNVAVREDLIYKNPIISVKKLRAEHYEMSFLDKDEIQKVLSVTRENYPNFYPLLFTAIMTGMREGEILALKWQDIDFVNKEIIINKTLFRNKIQPPKTAQSNRKINMPDVLLEVLKSVQKTDGEIVFPNKKGGYTDPNNMVKRYFKPCLRLAGIKEIRFHDLRHTFAALLIDKNVPPKYIQAQMGHSSIQVTMDRYGHLMSETTNKYRNILNDIKI